MNIKKILDELYKDFSPTMAMINAIYNIHMEFSDARKCVHVVYEKRGYRSACDFINMLSGYNLITLSNRTDLTTFITMIEEEKIFKKQQKKLAQKIRKNKK